MNFEKDEQTDSTRILKKSEVYEYEGETIDIGDPQKEDAAAEFEKEEARQNHYSGASFKVYQSNGSCLVVLGILLIVVLGLIFFLPLGLFLLGVALVGGLLRRLFN